MNDYSDTRQLQTCVYCGKPTRTRDHVPSKVLLDEPYPDNLAVVPSCMECNHGFSSDEEYFACLIEIMSLGTLDLEVIERNKVRRILSAKPKLKMLIQESITYTNGSHLIKPDWKRVESVVLKHAKGLSAYYMNTPIHGDNPSNLFIEPWTQMTEDQIIQFNQPLVHNKLPEVGSRVCWNLCLIEGIPFSPWIEVQENRFRYQTKADNCIVVRMVFSEYLLCELVWDEEVCAKSSRTCHMKS